MAELKECADECPYGDGGTLAGGGPLACRYTCGHVISRASGKQMSGEPQSTEPKKKKFAWSKTK